MEVNLELFNKGYNEAIHDIVILGSEATFDIVAQLKKKECNSLSWGYACGAAAQHGNPIPNQWTIPKPWEPPIITQKFLERFMVGGLVLVVSIFIGAVKYVSTL